LLKAFDGTLGKLHAPLRTSHDNIAAVGLGPGKLVQSSITEPRIVRFSKNYWYGVSSFEADAVFSGLPAQQQQCNPRFQKTRCSAIAERPRCRVRYSFRQK